jgi:hypothetical protein
VSIPELFGRYLVRAGTITEEELDESLRIQSEINRSFASKAIEGDFITIDQFKKARLLQRQKGILFCDALLELGYADKEKINAIEQTFSNEKVKLGELLVKRKMISEDELISALSKFKEYAGDI